MTRGKLVSLYALLTVDNAQSHVTAFRPISEAARSWSDDNTLWLIHTLAIFTARRTRKAHVLPTRCACDRLSARLSNAVRLIMSKRLNMYRQSNKFVFTILRRFSSWRYPHLLLSAGARAARARSCRSISPARRARSSKPASGHCCCRWDRQTDSTDDTMSWWR